MIYLNELHLLGSTLSTRARKLSVGMVTGSGSGSLAQISEAVKDHQLRSCLSVEAVNIARGFCYDGVVVPRGMYLYLQTNAQIF